MRIELRDLRKRFGAFEAIKGVSLDIADGELVALLGPSGSGKTTLLRIIAGLEHADSGAVRFDGADASAAPVRDRRVGFVFQHYALFRHMTVFENVAFGLRVRPRRLRPRRREIESRVDKLLSLVQLESLGGRYPSQLSGGQRQRVALARALAVEPKVLLLDEPFGALDARVREDLRRWLRRLHDEINITSVLVTHDQEEALEVADRVVVLNEGRVEQVGTSAEVYHHPANPFVCSFMGTVNLFGGRLADGSLASARANGAAGANGHSTNGAAPAHSALFYARPHEIDVVRTVDGRVHMRASVTRVNAAGPVVRVELATAEGAALHIDLSHERYLELRLVSGDAVFAVPRDLRAFDQGGGI